ncbi:MAG: hypothetical protein A2X67_12410 [Ignavibacteria bacterium GWA2_55_11]|nr:MAG: hypothetical protein A2X67_12410 [Ignavibacteria bacterium GWA2_55_11]OGU44061.1 MAG: hypothetical protein A2X68_05400 [Ignavibacteria bacterium GWC2_56_12]OGU71299.1 MAG: hypothetical protein A3G43_13490 [Ignavibacteria bacterium RIFCSPLOWO2_12_FULL_56_21]OGU75600.1 MAG: hypothetical protein A3H45_11515 [Ignavibacteria bacterium RIFCSPLOWO2_02_FULL_55_14]HAV24108.1 hypothetical protein [Bacteroidota bacterium]
MTRAEQTRLFEDLAPLQVRMSPKDGETFAALLQRHKDEEELDAHSSERLRQLHSAYKPAKNRQELELLWQKIASGRKDVS